MRYRWTIGGRYHDCLSDYPLADCLAHSEVNLARVKCAHLDPSPVTRRGIFFCPRSHAPTPPRSPRPPRPPAPPPPRPPPAHAPTLATLPTLPTLPTLATLPTLPTLPTL